MPPAVLDHSALDSLFSRASQWPSDGDWYRVVRDTAEHLIEHPATGMLMVLVPAGKFLTDTDGGSPFEVDLVAYYITVHPVTNSQYAYFVSETGHRPPDNRLWQNFGKRNHPVTDVSWNDATAYCRWAGLRLPTELEWEKAARGLDGRAYPWRNDWDPNGCRNEGNKAGETTADVWRYGLGGSPFGVLQLSGNVWEWCANRYDITAYSNYRQGNLTALGRGESFVLRGGAWDFGNSVNFSASCRRDYHHDTRYLNCGFRCVGGGQTSSA